MPPSTGWWGCCFSAPSVDNAFSCSMTASAQDSHRYSSVGKPEQLESKSAELYEQSHCDSHSADVSGVTGVNIGRKSFRGPSPLGRAQSKTMAGSYLTEVAAGTAITAPGAGCNTNMCPSTSDLQPVCSPPSITAPYTTRPRTLDTMSVMQSSHSLVWDDEPGHPKHALQLSQHQVLAGGPAELFEGVTGLSWLGEGGMGRVYTGFWAGAPTAFKFVLADSKAAIESGCREALISTRASHPNCVQTFWSRTVEVDASFLAAAKKLPMKPSLDTVAASGTSCLASRTSTVQHLAEPDGFESAPHLAARLGTAEGHAKLVDVIQGLRAKEGDYVLLMAMEWCDGGSLHDSIRRGFFKPRPKWSSRVIFRALLRTACEVAKGVLHLHNNGITHRDLKPGNVLLKNTRLDRRGFEAKVADFGLAHDGGRVGLDSPMWSTLDYMAPERFSSYGDKASDVWAFGVLLHTMWTGASPYGQLGQGAIAAGVQLGELRPAFDKAAPAALVELANDCMRHEPTERPTFSSIVDRLIRIEVDVRMEPHLSAQRHDALLDSSDSCASLAN